MEIPDLDNRLRRLNDALSHLLAGEFEAIDDYGEVADDPLGRIEETVQFLVMDIKTIAMANREKEASLLMQQEQLQARAETIERQAAAIVELSTPILEVWDQVLVLPLIGVIDTRRSVMIMTTLLDSIVRTRPKWVIIDVTGVDVVETSTAEYLLRVVRTAGLLGVACLLSGIQPAVAQTLVQLGADLRELVTKRNLRSALEHCLAHDNHRATRQG